MATPQEKKIGTTKCFEIPWSEIREPGSYVSAQTGRLFRIPDTALKEGHSPIIDVMGPNGEEIVTCVSTNAYTPIDKLRLLAADANIQPQF